MRLNKLTQAFTILTLGGLAALLSGGCAENRTTLFVEGVFAYMPGEDCEVDVSLGGNRVSVGTYDPGYGTPYAATLILANGLQPLGDNDTLRPETSRIQLQGAEVSITPISGGSGGQAFVTNFSGTIHPDESEDPGLAGLTVPVIYSEFGLAPGTYNVNIIVFGETLGGTKVESGEYDFPVQVSAPGAYAVCDSSTLDEEAFHPCGWGGQDGYVFRCDLYDPGDASGTRRTEGCTTACSADAQTP